MTRKTTESYGKHANRAQTERRFQPREISPKPLLDAFRTLVAFRVCLYRRPRLPQFHGVGTRHRILKVGLWIGFLFSQRLTTEPTRASASVDQGERGWKGIGVANSLRSTGKYEIWSRINVIRPSKIASLRHSPSEGSDFLVRSSSTPRSVESRCQRVAHLQAGTR
jgi:hypothetical protein